MQPSDKLTESIKFTKHEGNIMKNYRNEILDLLLAESEAMETADGKSVTDASVKSSSAPAGGEKSSKIKLTGGGDDVGGKLPATPPSGKVPGGEATMDDQGGKGVAKEGGDAKTSEGGKGEKMKPEGDSIADTSVKQTKDLPKNPNLAKEGKSFTLPHDVMVEHDGKVTKLAAGTVVTLVAESTECKDEKCKDEKCPTHGKKVAAESKDCDDHKDPACSASASDKEAKKTDKAQAKAMKESVVKEDENPFGGEDSDDKEDDTADKKDDAADKTDDGAADEAAESETEDDGAGAGTSESDIPEIGDDTVLADAGGDSNIIDRLAMSIDHFAKDFREFLGVEKEEPEHMEGDADVIDDGTADLDMPEMGEISDLPSDVGQDENIVNDDDLPEVGQSPNPFAR